uniref:Thioredoxin domain-containing protein n=1 Tax=Mus spicilegus TaxID=10103 RepID=A0A8C6HJ07_MUSSI
MMNGTATVIHLNQQERVSSKSQMLIMVKRIKNVSELKELFSDAGNKLVVVEFSAKWCGPCKTIAPVFQAMSLKYQNVMFAQVDVDSSKELAEHCDITMLPTFQMFKYTQKPCSSPLSFQLSGCNSVSLGDLQETRSLRNKLYSELRSTASKNIE